MTTLNKLDCMYVTGVEPEQESAEKLPGYLSSETIPRPSIPEGSGAPASVQDGRNEQRSPAAATVKIR